MLEDEYLGLITSIYWDKIHKRTVVYDRKEWPNSNINEEKHNSAPMKTQIYLLNKGKQGKNAQKEHTEE